VGYCDPSVRADPSVGQRHADRPGSQPATLDAPVAGRVCHTGVRLVPQITERLIAYGDATRTLTYQAEQHPRFLKAAHNHWRVEPIDQHCTRISLHATVQPQGVLGWLPYLLLRAQLVRVAKGFLQDLQYYLEHGRPSQRKQRRLDTSKR
jgi:Polyketide cyclase / dehydrase and lipid transport